MIGLSLGRALSAAAALTLLSTSVAFAGVRQQVTAQSHARPQVVLMSSQGGVRTNYKCPTGLVCLSITAKTPIVQEWCVSEYGNCSSGLIGTFDWTAPITILRNTKKAHEISDGWAPNPGNPSTITISTTAAKAAATAVLVSIELSACSSTYGCFSNFEGIGITN